MAKKHKSKKEEQLLLKQQNDQLIEDVLRFSKKRFKRFDEIIEQLYTGENLGRFVSTDVRILKISTCFNKLSTKRNLSEKKLLKESLIYLDKYSALVSDDRFIQAIHNMVQFKTYWKKNIFEWKPKSKQAILQVKELAGYLFCQYKVPDFMYQAFYESNNLLFVEWFIHLGTGRKVKELRDIPIPFTQRMGHYFLQSPSNMNIPEALRWAQVRGLGGDEKIAARIAYSWLGSKSFERESFWERFMQILVAGGMFNHSKIGELIDYVREAKRVNATYSLKGRTLQSLLKQSDEWHKRSSHSVTLQYWQSSGIEGCKFEREHGHITVEELISTRELIDEGKKMRHCVGSYSHSCAKGRTAIFSFRKYSFDMLEEILATIEVNISLKRIVQAKGRMNRPISNEVRKCMEVWAKKQALSIGSYL
jgi:hypothetical protein